MSSTAPTPPRVKKPIYKRVWFWLVVIAVLLLVGLGGCLAVVGSAVTAAGEAAPSATSSKTSTSAPAPAEDAATLNPAQKNAVRKAQEYLRFTAFSRTGLIKQLEFEKFSTADATPAVDSLSIDYDEQAGKKAKEYLKASSFSRDGLIDQLAFEGFTPDQAAAGASAAGL